MDSEYIAAVNAAFAQEAVIVHLAYYVFKRSYDDVNKAMALACSKLEKRWTELTVDEIQRYLPEK